MQPWINPFLDALKACGVQAEACRRVGCSYSAVMALKANNADFAHAVDEAMEEAVDRAEAAAWHRGVDGYDEPVVYQGQLTLQYRRDENGNLLLSEAGHPIPLVDANGNVVPLTVRKHSDALLALVLKGRRKKVFAERTEITGADGGAVNIDDTARAARVAQLMSLAAQRKAAETPEDFV